MGTGRRSRILNLSIYVLDLDWDVADALGLRRSIHNCCLCDRLLRSTIRNRSLEGASCPDSGRFGGRDGATTEGSIPNRQAGRFGPSGCGRDHDLARLRVSMRGRRVRGVFARFVVWAAITSSMASCSPGSPQALTSSALECTGNMSSGPPENYTVYFDAVALPAAPAFPVVETSRDPQHQATPRWMKAGLWFRPTAPFSLRIEEGSRARSAMGWGRPPIPAKEVVHEPCNGAQPGWAVLPGGFWGAADTCIVVDVLSGANRATAELAIGVACPA